MIILYIPACLPPIASVPVVVVGVSVTVQKSIRVVVVVVVVGNCESIN